MRLRDIFDKVNKIRGIEYGPYIITAEVNDHDDMSAVEEEFYSAVSSKYLEGPIIVTSQVPPGWMRKHAGERIFYQPHTIIHGRELECAVFPTHIAVGCLDLSKPLPETYQRYLDIFKVPVFKMSYETAELSKLALNYLLASQIETVNKLSKLADKLGASWEDIERVLRMDKRIGPRAYIHPGEVGGHLPRDVRTIERLLKS